MSKNHMEEVAKMLGVELGEPFKISDDREYMKWQRYYQLTSDGVEVSNDNVHWEKCMSEVLEWLLRGEIGIKLPWKPKKGEIYYFACPDDNQLCGCDTWADYDVDYHRLKHGLVFKSMKEAIKLAEEMLAALQEANDDE